MKKEFDRAINDPDNPVVDVNASGADVNSMLVVDNGPPELIDGTIENVLLYIHELSKFLDGDAGALLSKEPTVSVKPTAGSSVYLIDVGGRPVESMPNQSDDVLQAVKEAKEDGNLDPILDIYENIIDNQVRRDVVNELLNVLPNLNADRISITDRGWLVDGFYIVDWTASLYVITDDQDEDDYVRSGSDVKTLDKSKEFVELTNGYTPERKRVKFNGETTIVGEREMMFLSKVQWLMKRTKYHADEPFWRYNEKQRKEYLRGEQ